MAGEIFIARQDTLEAVQGTVEGIDTKADTTINTLGNFAGGGIEDTVAERLAALTGSVAQLQETVNTLINSGGGVNFKYTYLETPNTTSAEQTYTISNAGIVIGKRKWDSDTSSSLSIDSSHGGTTETYESQYVRGVIGLFKAGATITLSGYKREAVATAHIFEFV